MKKAKSSTLSLLLVVFALSSSPLRAEKVDETKYNFPDFVKSSGNNVDRNLLGIKIPEAPLIVRSDPVDMVFDITYVSSFNKAYVALRCKTPCKIFIPSFANIFIKVSPPEGYKIKLQPEAPKWKSGLIKNYLKPNDLVYQWSKE